MGNTLRSTFSHYLYNEETQQLSLFINEQNTPDRSFPLNTVSQYQIILNTQVVFSFNRDENLLFSQYIIDQLKKTFDQESHHKMIHNRIRKVSLVITIDSKTNYTICLYLRKGNRRFTKKRFNEVLEELITWCFITLKSTEDISNILASNSSTIVHENSKVNLAEPSLSQPAESNEKKLEKSNDADVINQLDKLITLKYEGLLSEDEFNLAKAELLNEFTKNE